MCGAHLVEQSRAARTRSTLQLPAARTSTTPDVGNDLRGGAPVDHENLVAQNHGNARAS
jgi:hypothetical protein